MITNRRFMYWMAAFAAPSLALVFAVHTASSTWERVRTKPKPQKRTLKVTGSATQRIVSDLIEWEASIATRATDRTAAYRSLNQHVATAQTYLQSVGVKQTEVRISAVETHEIIEMEYVGVGADRIRRRVSKGWSATQRISVRSHDIPRVERVSREITKLLEKGVPISSRAPRYHYTKLAEVKVDMLARASANARQRAQKIVQAAGGKGVSKLWAADMGVINVNPPNSTQTSWQGNNDKTSLEKDIITIVHLTYELP